MPIRRRTSRRAAPLSLVMSTPSSSTVPLVGSTSRLMQRSKVLFPAPDGPMMAVSPGSSITRSNSCSAGRPGPYSLVSFVILSIATQPLSGFPGGGLPGTPPGQPATRGLQVQKPRLRVLDAQVALDGADDLPVLLIGNGHEF